MANLTEFIGLSTQPGQTAVATWVGNETLYTNIYTVSAPTIDGVVNPDFDDTSADFDANFGNTIYFIHEDE